MLHIFSCYYYFKSAAVSHDGGILSAYERMSYYVLTGCITYNLNGSTYVFDFDNPSFCDDKDEEGCFIEDKEYNELYHLRSLNARMKLGWRLLSDKDRKLYNSLKLVYMKKYPSIKTVEIE